MKVAAIIGILALLRPLGASAAVYDDAGTAAGSFLSLGGGARTLAMGGAGVAEQKGPNAIFTNPAQLAREDRGGGSFTHGIYLEGTSLEQLAVSVPTPAGSFGIAMSAFRVGEIESYDNSGTPLGTFSPWDLSLSAAYAYPLGPVAVGGLVSYLQSELAPGSRARGFCADAGVSACPLPDFSVGISLQHMGTPLEYDREANALPLTIRAGASYELDEAGLVFVSDVMKPKDESASIRMGVNKAARVGETVGMNLRAGWRSGAGGGGVAGLALGGGISWRVVEDFMDWPARVRAVGEKSPPNYRISLACVDYAWTPMGELGQAHWFSFALMF